MTRNFLYQSRPVRVLFGRGTVREVAGGVKHLGGRSPLVVSTVKQAESAQTIADMLGPGAALFAEARMHTPVEISERGVAFYAECGADCIVSIGGGSTIGLGKAISWRNGAPHLAIATTYAGSEATDILGETEDGAKTTIRDERIRPAAIIYDPDLTLGVPVDMSVTSGMNAMSHAVEGLYARDANPISSMMALEGLRALKTALPTIVASPSDPDARREALYGSWLCGTVLGAVSMALHHKLCHVLGGTFDLPHAPTHSILLPYTAAYNAPAARESLSDASELFGGDIGRGLYDLAASLNAPLALRDIGLKETDLQNAAEQAMRNAYWNPRELSREGILSILRPALVGERPSEQKSEEGQ